MALIASEKGQLHSRINNAVRAGTPLFYRPFFYAHVALLHVSLVLRMVGDLGGGLYVRQRGGMLNAVAILLFLGSTIASVRIGRATTLKAGS